MSKNPLRPTLAPECVVAITDSRKQCSFDLSPIQSKSGTLDTGDYCLASCPDIVRIERKSIYDLIGCVGSDRERFEREVTRLLAFPTRVHVVQSTWEKIESHESVMPQWRGKVTKEAVIGSLLGWQAAGLSIHLAGEHASAGRHVPRLLYTIAKRRYRELRSLVEVVTQ
jgi:DNA excision repair protein ERCC-4